MSSVQYRGIDKVPWGGKRSSVMINTFDNENTVHLESVFSEFYHDSALHIHMELLVRVPGEVSLNYNNRYTFA